MEWLLPHWAKSSIRARYSRENVSSEYIGWSHFQAIWNQLVETQTDMFD